MLNFHIVCDTLYISFLFAYSLHDEMGIVSSQIVKNHRDDLFFLGSAVNYSKHVPLLDIFRSSDNGRILFYSCRLKKKIIFHKYFSARFTRICNLFNYRFKVGVYDERDFYLFVQVDKLSKNINFWWDEPGSAFSILLQHKFLMTPTLFISSTRFTHTSGGSVKSKPRIADGNEC